MDFLLFLSTDETEGDGNNTKHHHQEQQHKIYTDKALAELIDYVLFTGDKNQDGFIDYSEYRQKSA